VAAVGLMLGAVVIVTSGMIALAHVENRSGSAPSKDTVQANIAALSAYERELLTGHGPRGAFWTQWTRGGMWVQSDAARFGEVGNQPLQLQYVEALDQMAQRGLINKHSETSWSMTLEGWAVARALQEAAASSVIVTDTLSVLPDASVLNEVERLLANGNQAVRIDITTATVEQVDCIYHAYHELDAWLNQHLSQFELPVRTRLKEARSLLLATAADGKRAVEATQHGESSQSHTRQFYHDGNEYLQKCSELVIDFNELRRCIQLRENRSAPVPPIERGVPLQRSNVQIARDAHAALRDALNESSHLVPDEKTRTLIESCLACAPSVWESLQEIERRKDMVAAREWTQQLTEAAKDAQQRFWVNARQIEEIFRKKHKTATSPQCEAWRDLNCCLRDLGDAIGELFAKL
jgi:hypothetical protein